MKCHVSVLLHASICAIFTKFIYSLLDISCSLHLLSAKFNNRSLDVRRYVLVCMYLYLYKYESRSRVHTYHKSPSLPIAAVWGRNA